MAATVQEIIIERLISKIEKNNKLPWQCPFVTGCINWSTEKEYVGINKFLLDGGEYITPNQLQDYNKKNKTTYWFSAGDPYDIVVYYGPTIKALTDSQKQEIEDNGIPKSLVGKLENQNGEFVIQSWILRYHRVYNIQYIKDKEGNLLPPKMGKLFVETETEPEAIISNYCEALGVVIKEGSVDGAYYSKVNDRVSVPNKNMFASMEAYYRTIFHELVHSTGIESRLNRECYKKYHEANSERSREELIAEVGSLLLASEAGFREDTELSKNSENYIVGWIRWMKENTNEVVLGMQQAEKAKNYILNGGLLSSHTDETVTETDIS